MLKIAMLSTGEEILHGDIVDTNASWLSGLFYQNGFSLSKRSTVGDQEQALIEELLMLSFNSDVVIVNGGLGPTSDDMTASAAAQAADEELVLSPSWLQRMETMFSSRSSVMPNSNLKQAMLPKSATILDNPIGTACGFKMKINDATFYFTPGVPKEFKMMVEEQILVDLKKNHPDVEGFECTRLYTLGLSESGISDSLAPVELPPGYELGYRSSLPFIEVKVFGPSEDELTRDRVVDIIHSILEPNVVSFNETMLNHVGLLLLAHNKRISVAETSTQGHLSAWLRSEPYIEQCSTASWILDSGSQELDDSGDILASALALATATRVKCLGDIGLITGKRTGNQFALALSTVTGEWSQLLEFKRDYPEDDARTIIGALALDMLRRHLVAKPIFAKYGSVNRVREIYIPAGITPLADM
ncbi:competence/damage-inducible protein A [Vibrio sp. 10N.286.49.B3]|uniref:molybdopterin-binding protein n=1 Tax=Vibrio sp. 10N.286.49.B3 TaxID=1880855 RepID=UPI000C853C89|nr:molybdopterin-binding protein [Vibrio sp. 10N.286.49.B3]PMH46886.1 competence/damage-inducible protein A [Vibrio sp. 10N.286.49.B3]